MAKVHDLTDEEFEANMSEWLSGRPAIVHELARRVPPGRLYRLRTSGQRVEVYSYEENGTLTVSVTGKYNLVSFERRVFGIRPEDLEECDLPGPHEPLGSADIPVEVVREEMKRKGLL